MADGPAAVRANVDGDRARVLRVVSRCGPRSVSRRAALRTRRRGCCRRRRDLESVCGSYLDSAGPETCARLGRLASHHDQRHHQHFQGEKYFIISRLLSYN